MTTTEPATFAVTSDPAAAEALSGRLFMAGLDAVELSCVYLGHTLGLYRALADSPGQTIAELAATTGLDHRYTREWVQAQLISGLLTGSSTDLDTTRLALPPGGAEALVDEVSPFYLVPIAQAMAALGNAMPQLLHAFRTGAGVPLSAYGPDGVAAQSAFNRPMYHHELVGSWLAAVPDVAARLADTAAPARVADLGCGAGWAAIALASAYPHLRVDGYDADEASIALARRNAAEHAVADRVRFEVTDLTLPATAGGGHDLVLMLECLHDMSFPVRALRHARSLIAEGGAMIVAEEATDDELVAATEDPMQRFFANVSPVWCLPQSRTEPDADPVGTVIRTAHVRALAAAAGFARVEVLPIAHPFFRFYRLSG